MDNSLILYENQSVDYLLYNPVPFSQNEINTLKAKTATIDLKWTDFKNVDILCDFKTSITSSFIEGLTGELVGFDVRKRKQGDSFYTKVVFIPIAELQESVDTDDPYYSITDYNVSNNNEYIYTVFPVTSDAIGVSLENKYTTDWDIYTLTPLIQVDSTNLIADDDRIWSFSLNCEESEIVHVQDKTKFPTFASKPKVSVGDLNYREGSFKCLLGGVSYNGKYDEPYELVQKWNDFVSSNPICLFKNLKGDAMIVTLENETHSYMDKVFGIPTNISFNYTEVMDTDNLSIYKIGD